MSARFNGKHIHGVDAKGRIIVPVKFREKLGERFIVTLGADCCLSLYPLDEWDKLLDKMDQNLPGTDEGRYLLTYLSGNAEEVEMDKQGRVLIPQELRDEVGITKDIISVGTLEKVKVFSMEAWEEYNKKQMSREDIAKAAASFGIRL